MASILCLSSIIHINSGLHLDASWRLRRRSSGVVRRIRCESGSSSQAESDSGSKSENVVLRLAWYGSEVLGIAASLFRPSTLSTPAEEVVLTCRLEVAEAIKEDFARSYFVTVMTKDAAEADFRDIIKPATTLYSKGIALKLGIQAAPTLRNLTLEAYDEDCEFADPAGSFKGLRRFKRNCSNFGALLERSNVKLTKWEDFEDKSIGHWRFSWHHIISPETNSFWHVEHWNVSKMALLKQIFKPCRWVSERYKKPAEIMHK